jgi:cytochrome c biogenesis protein CcmG/thiol:disulfide interchange protein DsbE
MNLKYLVLGLLLVMPLLYFLGRGFEFDPKEIKSPLIGKEAPVFSLPVLGSTETMALSSYRGKPVVVNFWATWCVPCKQEHGLLLQAAARYGENVQFIGIVYQDTEEKIKAWLGSQGTAYPTLIDMGSRAAIAFGVYGVPETFFLDSQGIIVDKYAGPLPAAYLVDRLEHLLGGRL